MKVSLFFLLGLVADVSASSYKLGAGDLVKIQVYQEPDLSLDVRIDPSGKISFPLLGEVSVAGLSPNELEMHLVKRLKGPYLVTPSVRVSIDEYRPFYVNGEVENPGSYAFQPGLTIDRAVSIAGGFTERASKDSISVAHDSSSSLLSDKKSVAKKKSVTLSDDVQPGDVITVKQSFF
jgi:protein involved in polysaccharide export with SLBB domain